MYKRLVLHIPHAAIGGLNSANWSDRRLLYEEVRRWTDWYTDYLFDQHAPNTKVVMSEYSRFVVDCERLQNDPLEKVGRGILYTHACNGCERYIDEDERARLMAYYVQNRDNLRGCLTKESILIDCHSFPFDEADLDICIGYNEDWSKPDDTTLMLVRDKFIANGYKVAFNIPYSNSISPKTTFAYPSLMIEVNKRCYMDEDTMRLTPKADKLRNTINDIYTMLLND